MESRQDTGVFKHFYVRTEGFTGPITNCDELREFKIRVPFSNLDHLMLMPEEVAHGKKSLPFFSTLVPESMEENPQSDNNHPISTGMETLLNWLKKNGSISFFDKLTFAKMK